MSENARTGITINRDTINKLMTTIQNLYLSDDIPWVIGYSGGKDSTATLQLVWLSLERLDHEQLHKPVHIINTDTLVENPAIATWVQKSFRIMDSTAKEKGLPFVTHRLTPPADNTFWTNFLGKGYPFPRKKFRWCTDRLKIQPVNNFIKSKIAEHGEIILVLGTRKAESTNRAKTMEHYEKQRVRELLSPNPTLANELVFSPLAEWTNDDVWIFLMQYPNPWGFSNNELLTLYRGATADNECPLMVEKDLPSCGKSRFGCWVCTMVEQDKSMEAMIINDDEKAWMTPLLEFRNEFGDESKDRDRRTFRRLKGNIAGSYKRLYHGPYKKEWREKWLKDLLEIQKDINENGPEEVANIELITVPELRTIRRIWVNEKHEFDDAVPRIYKDVMKKDFDDPQWISETSFGQEEWNILKDVAKECYPEEELAFEMMYDLIDIESKASANHDRKGLMDSLEKTIKKTFYKNEDDALAYYTHKNDREKEYGGSYDERFDMDYIKESSEHVVFSEEEENLDDY